MSGEKTRQRPNLTIDRVKLINAKVKAFEKQDVINNGWTYFLEDLKTVIDAYESLQREKEELAKKLAEIEKSFSSYCFENLEKIKLWGLTINQIKELKYFYIRHTGNYPEQTLAKIEGEK